MIEFKNVTKIFDSKIALENLSFKIKSGEIVGFLGPNGAGKTTAMRLLLGLLEPSKGKILVDGLLVEKESVAIREKIGYLPEDNPLYQDFKVWQYLEFIGNTKDTKDLKKALKMVVENCGLKSVLSDKIETLSRGFKQRVGLAAALISDPEILVLDEPTSGLDPNQIAETRKLIKNLARKKTVILSTHILPEVQAICRKVIIINKGKLVAQETIKSLTKGKPLEKIFRKLTIEE